MNISTGLIGIIECVSTKGYGKTRSAWSDDGNVDAIDSTVIRDALENSLDSYLRFLDKHESRLPYVILLTIIGARDHFVGKWVSRGINLDDNHPIDRHVVSLPEVVIENPRQGASSEINRLMDYLFNAGGVDQEPAIKE